MSESESLGSYLSEHKVGVHTTDKLGVTRKTEFTVTVAHIDVVDNAETIYDTAAQAITETCLEKFAHSPYSIQNGEIFELLDSEKKDRSNRPVQAFFMSKTFVQQF